MKLYATKFDKLALFDEMRKVMIDTLLKQRMTCSSREKKEIDMKLAGLTSDQAMAYLFETSEEPEESELPEIPLVHTELLIQVSGIYYVGELKEYIQKLTEENIVLMSTASKKKIFEEMLHQKGLNYEVRKLLEYILEVPSRIGKIMFVRETTFFSSAYLVERSSFTDQSTFPLEEETNGPLESFKERLDQSEFVCVKVGMSWKDVFTA